MPQEPVVLSEAQKPTNTPKKSFSWKLILKITVLAAIIIGGLGYASVVFDIFGTKIQETSSMPKQSTMSAKPIKKDVRLIKSGAIFMSPGALKNKIAFVKSEFIREKDSSTGTATLSDFDIFVVNPNGTGFTKIIDNKEEFWSNLAGAKYWGIDDLSWSPKGEYLSWLRNGERSIFEFVETKDNASVYQLKSRVNKTITGYSISPNEKMVALIESYNSPKDLPSEFTAVDVRVVDLKSGEQLALLNVVKGNGGDGERVFAESQNFAWLDSNTFLAITRTRGKINVGSFDVARGLSSGKIILDSESSIFTLNDSNSKIAYLGEGKEPPDSSLWIANVNGRGAKNLVDLAAAGTQIDFSPDGSFVASAGSNAEYVELSLLDLNTNKKVKTEVSGLGFGWSPDSRSLVSLNGVYSNNLVIVGIDGRIKKQLTKEDMSQKIYYYSPTWFPAK